MGTRFSRGRDTQAVVATETVTEQKTAEQPAPVVAADPAPISQTQEPVKTENLEPAALKSSPTAEESVSESKAADAPAATVPTTDAEPAPAATETPAPVQPEPEPPVEPSPPEPEPVAEPEVEIIPEPISEPEVEAVPEPIPEPLVEIVPEPIPEPEPVEVLEEMEESLPEPEISSAPLIDLGVPDLGVADLGVLDVTPESIDIPPIAALVNIDEPLDVPAVEEDDIAEVSVIPELEKCELTPEPVENLVEVEVEAGAGDLQQLVNDVNEENVRELLKGLELKGNDLVADLIPTDDKIPDGVSVSTDLM